MLGLMARGAVVRAGAVVLVLCAGACRERKEQPAAGARGARETDAALVRAMADSTQWVSYGRDQTNQRYSPLTQITTSNVAQLQPVWTYHTGIAKAFEASPVVVDGVMYVSTSLNHVVALDAATGRKRWEYAPTLGVTVHCCGPVNRGVAYYDGKVYMGQLDGKFVALDAKDGHVVWSKQLADNNRGYSLTSAPVAADGKVIIGVSGAEYGIRGFLVAFDANSGAEAWRFYTIPAPNEAPNGWWGTWATTDPFGTVVHKDRTAERRDSAKYPDAWRTGGGSVWQAPTIDRQLGLVIFTVGNASPDLDGSVRPGDNLYTNSLVAVTLADGKYRWHMQEIPHDLWDLDVTSPTVLVDVRDSATGQTVPAVAEAGKTGWVYVVDRRTGKPIRKSEPFVPMKNMFAPPTPEGTFMIPGANGGSEWSPPAYSPQTGYLYVLGLHQPMLYKVRSEPLQPPAFWLGGAFLGVTPQAGTFSAVDLNTGRIAWQNRYPVPMIGGALATAGGLVFVGTGDKRFIATDAKTGRELWNYNANAGVNAPPITYAINGRQYVAVAIGGNYQINTPRGDEVVAFALPAGGAPAPGTAPTTTGAGAPPPPGAGAPPPPGAGRA
ncbi:MAG: PQQ-dependent dehydrogenase, methanol/ethanol family, partial [Gemmatimonadetes bacterium]|nr:PQQ-dependent dehydrogenase, methanol/ethanol family [Gemmatimonadota bacterium]